jgi:hypothetical protein
LSFASQRASQIFPSPCQARSQSKTSRKWCVKTCVPNKIVPLDYALQIRDARPQLQHRHLRLIHAGRLLSDATLLYDWLRSLEERQRRVVADDQFVDKAKGKSKAVDDADTAWVNCSVGPAFKPGEEHEEKPQASTPTTRISTSPSRFSSGTRVFRPPSCNLSEALIAFPLPDSPKQISPISGERSTASRLQTTSTTMTFQRRKNVTGSSSQYD